VPFNTASYAAFTMMVAQCVDMAPGDFIHTFGDLHMYSNHVEGAKEWITREPFAKPILRIDPTIKDIFGFKWEHFKLEDYKSHPKINFDVAY
jgi:thymidylate synthase